MVMSEHVCVSAGSVTGASERLPVLALPHHSVWPTPVPSVQRRHHSPLHVTLCVRQCDCVCVCVYACVRVCLRALQAAEASLVSQHVVAFTLLDKVHNLQTRHSAGKTAGSLPAVCMEKSNYRNIKQNMLGSPHTELNDCCPALKMNTLWFTKCDLPLTGKFIYLAATLTAKLILILIKMIVLCSVLIVCLVKVSLLIFVIPVSVFKGYRLFL